MSPFSALPSSAWIASNDLAFAVADGFPVARGHTLIITKREVATWFDASPDEQAAVMSLVGTVKTLLEQALSPAPDGWNVGLNAGSAAGQTVPHLHVHVIPRWHGDVTDPRGGVRHVIPGKGNYLAPSNSDADLCTGHPDDPFLQRLLPELPGAREVDILAAFVQPSGVSLIETAILSALSGGAVIRILAGDYLGISSPIALRRLLALSQLRDPDWPSSAACLVAVAEVARLRRLPSSFHPKAWRIRSDGGTTVWVGSSNLSHAALVGGIEWNLRATSSLRPDAVQAVAKAFELIWSQATPLTAEWIAGYEARVHVVPPEPEAVEPEPANEAILPRPWQVQALARLVGLRREGFRRALAPVATGMGKTMLAALDVRQVQTAAGNDIRVIVIAHRAEILAQAAATLRRVLGHGTGDETWCLGNSSDLSGRVVLASVQKLARPEMLERLAAGHFNYAIVDEVHHAEAPTWRRVLDRLQADFVLGLTATPERADGQDVAAIFDDVLACEAGIAAGITEGSLVPFAYHGIADDVDYSQIPWRNGRFDDALLETALSTSPRMERLWTTWNELPGSRTLVFCCSRRHARFACDWLRRHGVAAAAVFSGEGSDDRGAALHDLAQGRLQAVCAVDLFNEGIDVPAVDRVVMLRPTESNVIFAQQLGRGLRTAPDKSRLIVIDFVGNHKVFGWRLRHLLALAGQAGDMRSLRRLIDGEPPDLPPGCTLDVELAAIDLLRRLLPTGGGAVLDAYRDLRDEFGRRPLMAELLHRGYLPQTLRGKHDHWFAFLDEQGDLSDVERQILTEHGDWLRFVETTSLTRSWKMVVLRVLLDSDALLDGAPVQDHATKARAYLLGHPVLRADLEPSKEMPDHRAASIARWAAWWKQWPIDHLAPWISVEAGTIRNRLRVRSELVTALLAMTAEIVDGRLADYAIRRTQPSVPASFMAKVSHTKGKPILFLPTQAEEPGRPITPTEVRLPDGSTWVFRFVKIACNKAHPPGVDVNQLPELLRRWFGERAGLPGTNFQVRFVFDAGCWSAAPVQVAQAGAEVAAVQVHGVIGFPPGMVQERPDSPSGGAWVKVIDLAAAASGFSAAQEPEGMGWIMQRQVPVNTGLFVAQVRGHSMEPTIPDGAWCLFRHPVAGSRDGRVLLVQHRSISDPEHGGKFTVKRYRSTKVADGDSWRHASINLEPDNTSFQVIAIDPHQSDDLRVVAEFVRVLG
jgi:superfamily II DNA or RNA helicase/diadenosine tetraphosphate (Ap4A) HIT family hydrolase/HKD family nuclease